MSFDTGWRLANLLLWAVGVMGGPLIAFFSGVWDLPSPLPLLITAFLALVCFLVAFGILVAITEIRGRFYPPRDRRQHTFRDAFNAYKVVRGECMQYSGQQYSEWVTDKTGGPENLIALLDCACLPRFPTRGNAGDWQSRNYSKMTNDGQILLEFLSAMHERLESYRIVQAKFWDCWALTAKQNGGSSYKEVLESARSNYHLVIMVAALEVLNDARIRKRGAGKRGLYAMANKLMR